MSSAKPRAVIIGAGPAGLTAAYEFLEQTEVLPVVLEASDAIGGISKTVNYKGNRIDIGGHRFFSKSDLVMAWWTKILPIEKTSEDACFSLRYQGRTRVLTGTSTGVDPGSSDSVMLVRSRVSRIYYRKNFFNYPVKLELQTIRNLGWFQMIRIGLSYVAACLFPLPERSLEEFFVNRFGRVLYNTFFRDYTEKVWGVPCSEIAPDWGAQRVKGLSITGTLLHALKSLLPGRGDLAQKSTETSLIEYFLYPKYGPGQMWETVAEMVQSRGGTLMSRQRVTRVHAEGDLIKAVTVTDGKTGVEQRIAGDYFISTMPISELVSGLEGVEVPADVKRVAAGLPFRDFITVGLLMRKLPLANQKISDNWIYIQDPEVNVGRLQIFNNWSPYMVKDPGTVWLGLEYFVNEGDEIWNLSDEEMSQLGIQELVQIGLIQKEDVLDSTVVRMRKTYPAYFGTYKEFDVVRGYLDRFRNLFLVGRNGMHRYNNQDHSMLTAMASVENIRDGRVDKSNIWDINVEQEYHEE